MNCIRCHRLIRTPENITPFGQCEDCESAYQATLPERRHMNISDYWQLRSEEQDEVREYLALLYPESERTK